MYGDNTAQLREALGTLMQITRNRSDVDDLPADAVELIGSFRHSITVWCQQAVRASNPHAELGGTTPRTRGPAEELRYRLAAARSAYAAPSPPWTNWPRHTRTTSWTSGDKQPKAPPSENTTSLPD
ncbi:hypothetical protein [Nocardioides alcanivorans]|uniref:hypothetical protein n=1 Tax=Nocardioides alcanivorans TaxID=2897352 RepID=UPI001F1F955F|nr:hypothetical protein [Nocardioides alcanivorans]